MVHVVHALRNRQTFHSRFLCYQCVFDPVPLSTLSFFSCALAFSSNLICWRPKEIYRRAENQCHCCGIYHFERPDLICDICQSAVDEISMLKRKIEQSEKSIIKLQAHTERAHAQETCAMSQKQTSLLTRSLRQKYTP